MQQGMIASSLENQTAINYILSIWINRLLILSIKFANKVPTIQKREAKLAYTDRKGNGESYTKIDWFKRQNQTFHPIEDHLDSSSWLTLTNTRLIQKSFKAHRLEQPDRQDNLKIAIKQARDTNKSRRNTTMHTTLPPFKQAMGAGDRCVD